MNYLIIGGAGFIGPHLSEELLKQGHDIIMIDNFNGFYNPKLKEENHNKVGETANNNECLYKLYKGDIRDKIF